MIKIIFLFLSLITLSVFADNDKNTTSINIYRVNFQSNIKKMMEFYSQDEKLWQDRNCIHSGACVGHEQGLWFWAQSEMLLANYQQLTGDNKYSQQLKEAYTANWDYIINAKYYDDRLWWAISLIKIYQVTGDTDALNRAKALVISVMAQGQQNICHGKGGIYWDVAKTQVGSIANSLLIIASSQLYFITHDKNYKNIANKTWDWYEHSGLINSDFTMVDNYAVKDNKCGNLISWRFTYNNGMLITALSNLAKMNNQNRLNILAKNVAKKAIYDYTKGGMIEENCTNVAACADDKFMFKGIFVYNLAEFAKLSLDKSFVSSVRKILADNYATLLSTQGSAQVYAFHWSLPINFERDDSLYNPADIVSHLSIMYLELANIILN